MLVGCASAPTPELHPTWYEIVQAGQVARAQAPRMADCVADGWRGAHGVLVNVTMTRERRADESRIEARTNSAVIARADIGDDGATTMVQWRHAPVNLSTERATFASCLARFNALSAD